MSLGQMVSNKVGGQLSAGTPSGNVEKFLIDDSNNVRGRQLNGAKDNLEIAIVELDKAKFNILKASDDLHEKMESLSRKASDAVKRSKDATAQMTDSMNKMTKILGPDFDKRIAQLESITDCLERLSLINTSGKLSSVIEALSKR